MATIAIILNPHVMASPDLDILNSLPGKIHEETNGAVTDDGYEYLEDSNIVIYLASKSLDKYLGDVLRILEDNKFSDNHILETAIIGIKTEEKYTVIHPKDYKDNIAFE